MIGHLSIVVLLHPMRPEQALFWNLFFAQQSNWANVRSPFAEHDLALYVSKFTVPCGHRRSCTTAAHAGVQYLPAIPAASRRTKSRFTASDGSRSDTHVALHDATAKMFFHTTSLHWHRASSHPQVMILMHDDSLACTVLKFTPATNPHRHLFLHTQRYSPTCSAHAHGPKLDATLAAAYASLVHSFPVHKNSWKQRPRSISHFRMSKRAARPLFLRFGKGLALTRRNHSRNKNGHCR